MIIMNNDKTKIIFDNNRMIKASVWATINCTANLTIEDIRTNDTGAPIQAHRLYSKRIEFGETEEEYKIAEKELRKLGTVIIDYMFIGISDDVAIDMNHIVELAIAGVNGC